MSLNRLRNEIGLPGLVALVLLTAAVLFSSFVVRPLQDKSLRLQDSVSRKAPAKVQPGADKVGAVYQFLEKQEDVTDWLAKLHGIGAATGVHLKSANYRTQSTEGRIVRYEIVLPVAGSYTQIRDFLKRSLAEIPVLSVDQLTLKREARSDGAIQAEMRLTLHMVKT
jgi:Tfp pilus assembly protein PilO